MALLPEVVVIPTYKRPELLYWCVANLRGCDYRGPIVIFPDKNDPLSEDYYHISATFDALVMEPAGVNLYGNSYNAARALRYGSQVAELTIYLEDDVQVTARWLPWTRKVHEESKIFSPIFCSAGWVNNRERPICDETYFSPWLYIPQFSISKKVLEEKILPHFCREYFEGMAAYCKKTFPNSPLNKTPAMNNHFEIDGLIQHIISEDQSLQVAWNAWATVKHLGFAGYNRGGYQSYKEFFGKAKGFNSHLDKIIDFATDAHWRMEVFGREIVEREEGRPIAEREYTYLIKLPDGAESTFVSPLRMSSLPKTINSVRLPEGTEIQLVNKNSGSLLP